jgi:hypothetical protein
VHDSFIHFSFSSSPGRPRCYWLEPNIPRVNQEKKPHFGSATLAHGLTPLPIHDAPTNPPPTDLNGLYAVARHDDVLFMLYSGKEQPDAYTLPVYRGGSQTVKQVLLTPFAMASDATVVGAVIGYYSAPSMLSALNR